MQNEVVRPATVDITKLFTVQNYAKRYGLSRPTVYTKIKTGELVKVSIDGVTFVKSR